MVQRLIGERVLLKILSGLSLSVDLWSGIGLERKVALKVMLFKGPDSNDPDPVFN